MPYPSLFGDLCIPAYSPEGLHLGVLAMSSDLPLIHVIQPEWGTLLSSSSTAALSVGCLCLASCLVPRVY